MCVFGLSRRESNINTKNENCRQAVKLHDSVVTQSSLPVPQARDRLPPSVRLSLASSLTLGLRRAPRSPHIPTPTSWKDEQVEREH